jgi:S1-C subfamily serine protease
MSNRLFFISFSALLTLIFLSLWLIPVSVANSGRSPNELIVGGLRDERSKLADIVAKGCESAQIYDYLDAPQSQRPESIPGRVGGTSSTAIDRKLKNPEALTALLDSSVVLILGKKSHGSGFFVAPNLIVTNSHVVEEDEPDGFWITSKALGKVVNAKVIRKTVKSEVGQTDFAVLRVAANVNGTPLAISEEDVTRLSPVIAAGFPGIIVRTDPRLNRLFNGDPRQAPETVLTPGEVSVTQPQSNGIKLIIHTADISAGNSGGPLVDRCGRVVGVNTFIAKSTDYSARVLYALSSSNLAFFLRLNNIAFTSVTDICGTGA